ncbi:transporter substrate-binding domain-containing protein [Acidaminobacter sp. JC074]|uniref:substrate-binding periplasmic protein n=1 Tax=Acidaminobacter sp. JC074 TaxID=2530199 RepID=UPI001F103396|nr:transporter substrate-binding domain-containing protein [Acidaminobacter sp. JC074]MCH4889514.1 transporter substrate-binding domain-containing protein [Acidaminobacter sp. JC074]
MFKKIGLIIIFLLLVSCVNENVIDENISDDVKPHETIDTNTVYAVGSYDWYPYQMMDENKQPYGMSYDILELILEDTDFNVVRNKVEPFRRQLQDLETGKVDVFVGLYFNEDRDKKYIYTLPFSKDEVCVFVRTDNIISFTSYADLSEFVGLIPDGASYGDTFENNKHLLNLREVKDEKHRLDLLLNEEVDYYISAYGDVMDDANQYGYEELITCLDKKIQVNDVYFVISKHSPLADHIDYINEQIQTLSDKGILTEIKESYMKNED